MSGAGPAKRRRIAGERSTGTPAAGSPSALPGTSPTSTPRRPTRPVRKPTGGGTGGSSSTSTRDRSGAERPRRTRTPRAGAASTRTPSRSRGPRLRTLLSPPSSERGWFVPLAAAAALCLVAGLALAGYGGWRVQTERRVVDAREAAASAAGTAIETMYTYDSGSLDADSAKAERLMTPAFRGEYAKIIDTLGELGDQRQIDIRSTARDTAAMPCGDECSATTQRVMVFFDLSRSAGEGTVPDVFGNRVALTMRERDGRWLVDKIAVL